MKLLPVLLGTRTFLIAAAVTFGVSVLSAQVRSGPDVSIAALRTLYAGPPAAWPRPQLDQGAQFEEFGPLSPADPADAGDPQVAVGRRLFEEPRLSGSGQIACASCHNEELGFGDGLRTSFGHHRKRGRRNAPPLFAVAWTNDLFWDGRLHDLTEQVISPLSDPLEMAGDRARVVRWINRAPDYRSAFEPIIGRRRIALADIAAAIARYERSLRPPRNRWDRVFETGIDALSDQQLRGLHLFRTKAGCANCHSGPLLTDRRFHNLGLGFYGTERQDVGRFAVTGRRQDVGAFRTPSLRGLIHSRPYMHNGFFPFLEPVVIFYASGGRADKTEQVGQVPPPVPDPLLRPRDLSRDEREALVAFLMTL